ncbi:MAG: hypothetical protein KC731_26785 [Myxococcales bacterium]|nr:hypothetical protein [Myxococcales bacterium]
MSAAHHSTTRGWAFPPPRASASVPSVNLRELAARPGRFEHHLMVVATIGEAQLEIATASEPLYFAHANISDEYAVALPTGHPLVDGVRALTFLSDPESGDDVGRIRHGVGQLVLHPHGLLHWTGRLRPPFAPFDFPPDGRRTGVTLVFCGRRPTAPSPRRPLAVTPSAADAVKAYAEPPPPFGLWDLAEEPEGEVARVGQTSLRLVHRPEPLSAPRGGYAVVLAAGEASLWWPTDLLYLPPGEEVALEGVERALVAEAEVLSAAPPPASWTTVPAAPFAPFEDGPPGIRRASSSGEAEREGAERPAAPKGDQRRRLPLSIDGEGGHLSFEEAGELVAVRGPTGAASLVPRYWLARMAFRLALHDYAIGYLETYGGFFYDDRDGHRLGTRAGGAIRLRREAMAEAVERLYRAVAPPGYVEDLR